MPPAVWTRLNARWDHLRGEPGSRRRRVGMVVEVVIIGLLGCWLGLLAGGHLDASVGPLETRMSVVPNLHGGTEVAIPPLGELTVDSHDGPWRLNTEVTRINAGDARRIFSNPSAVNGLGEQVVDDLTGAAITLVARAVLAGVLGALLLGLLVFRRRFRLVFASAGVSLAVILGGGAAAAATWDPESIQEPQYSGLLASAPTVVGDAQSIVNDFQKYEAQLAKLVTNVSRLYDVTSTLPAYQPDPSTIRVLFVSDIHLNPSAWEVIRPITEQFNIDVIVDAGDISDHGTAAENAFIDPIATLGVPYVWVRGNHDSAITQAAVASQPNAVVLDGEAVEVEGLRFIGAGDPRFTPDKNTRDAPAPPSVAQVALGLDDRVEQSVAAGEPVDVAVMHDGAAARVLDGDVPLVLSGHYHRREQTLLPDGTLSFLQGSTGASGLRGLEKEKPTPVRASVLYFDRDTRTLQAWDDITLGGLGLVSAKIERRIYSEQFPPEEGATESPTPAPSSSAPLTPGDGAPSGSPSP